MADFFDVQQESGDDFFWASLLETAEASPDHTGCYGPDTGDYTENSDFREDCGTAEAHTVKKQTFSSSQEALKVLFGYDSFRPGQKAVIDSILSGRDAFAVMPTGAGKSLCYQIPALLLPGITLVISPLISLMQDQVKALHEAGVAAAFINSSLSESAFCETVRRVKQGQYQLIYVAPERLLSAGFVELAKNVEISMVTIDEAHCISQWGQDFRPSYMKIVEFVNSLDRRPIISAFTATATENVREDIVCALGLRNPFTLVTGFDRENLFFRVEKPKNKNQYILDYIQKHAGDSGIIYCATRKNVDSLYELLKNKGISVAKYHAGMAAEERKQMQEKFVFDCSDIVVATNAFGMGIDKSNVRFVIHYNMPQSMENYYQEAGRAGRDGLPSECILLFSAQDIVLSRFLLDHKEVSDLEPADLETVRERDVQRLQKMERYCYTTECLRNYILKYFGENQEKPCGDCGNCLREFETLDMTEEAKKLINCVYETKGRYGRNIIIDTVIGAKTARLEEIGASRYRSYGALASTKKNLLKRLIDQLVLDGYLTVGDYQVIRLGNIRPLKKPDTRVVIKITDEDKLPEKAQKAKKTAAGIESLTSTGFRLYDQLKALRLEIAREEKMPPYIIFSDKTLIDMAARVPHSEAELLQVSGVGENKLAKYGKRFLATIAACITENPKPDKTGSSEQGYTESTAPGKKKKAGKQEFNLLKEEAASYQYNGNRYISEIRDEMNRICGRDDVKKLYATRLTEILLAEGLIAEKKEPGHVGKMPTEKGTALGIEAEERISEKGNSYMALKYSEAIQRMLVAYYTMEDG